MKVLTVYADPAAPDHRVYELGKAEAVQAFEDTLGIFRAAAFKSDLGMNIEKPKHNIVGQIQSIKGTGMVGFHNGRYTVFIRDGASWETIDPQIRDILANAFGGIETVNVVEGSV